MRAALYVVSQILLFAAVAVLLRLTLFPRPEVGTDWAITLAYGSVLATALVITWRSRVTEAFQALLWCAAAWLIGRIAGDNPLPAILVFLALAFVCCALNQKAMGVLSGAVGVFGIIIALRFGDGKPDYWYLAVWNWLFAAMWLSPVITIIGTRDDNPKSKSYQQRTFKKAA